MGQSSKARTVRGAKQSKISSRNAISSSSPVGLLALHLISEWKNSKSDGVVFLAENEVRAERLGAIIHALDDSCDVLVFLELNTLPFDQLEPSREIAGRRSSVLRRHVCGAVDKAHHPVVHFPILSRAVSIFRVRIRSSSVGPKDLVLPNFTSSGGEWDAAAYAHLRIC